MLSGSEEYELALKVWCRFCGAPPGTKCCGIVLPSYPHVVRFRDGINKQKAFEKGTLKDDSTSIQARSSGKKSSSTGNTSKKRSTA